MPKAKAKMGRPTLFNEKLADRILELARKGKTDAQIAARLRIGLTALKNWKGRFPDFAAALKEQKDVADGLVEASLFQRAIGYSHREIKCFQYEGMIITKEVMKHYPPDVTAQIFWLKNRKPEQWREKVIHDHQGGIEVNDKINGVATSDMSVQDLLAEYQKRTGGKKK